MDWIRIADMLATMQMRGQDGSLIPFKITFVTASVTEGTGGERITYENAVLVGGAISRSDARNPDHFANYTRNLKSLDNDEIRKFRPLLVDYFNDKTVTL